MENLGINKKTLINSGLTAAMVLVVLMIAGKVKK